MRRLALSAALALAALPVPAALAADDPLEIRDGPARIQVLSPTLFRLEYAADEVFEDRPTLTAVDRRGAPGEVTAEVVDGVRVIRTSAATLRYAIGSGPFGSSNLQLTLKGGHAQHTVAPTFAPPGDTSVGAPPPERTPPYPGDPAPRTQANLGGWFRGLDGQSGAVPLHDGVLSRDGWYLLNDSSSPLLVAGGRWFEPRPAHQGAYQDGYLFAYGRDYAAGLQDFRNLTGPAPLLPRKAFGTWFSQYTFFSEREYRRLLERFHREQVPLDVLVVDTDVKAPNPWNGWEWTSVFSPDPARFLRWAHSKGLDVALNVHPSISLDDPAYPAAAATAGGLAPDSGRCVPHIPKGTPGCAVFDWAQPAQTAAYFGLHAPFESDGVDFWWLDWNSDESNAVAPGLTPDTWINSLYAQHERDRGGRWLTLSRIGSSFWAYDAAMPGAWAEHRYSIHFTGDAYPTWAMLDFEARFTAAEGAGIGLPYVSHDIGSFQGSKLPADLYVRWVQLGAFQPLLRLHSDHGKRLPWQYGKVAHRIAGGFLRLRETLVPYLYTAARQAYDTGIPIARPMYLSWPQADPAYRFDSQYMLGDELLVAPVARPGRVAARRVWFPPGRWVDVFTGAEQRGGRVERLSVPLGQMPVFARAGAIVPRAPAAVRASGRVDPLALDVYAGADGAYQLYEDAGDGLAYESGEHARTSMRWAANASAGTLTIGRARGRYRGMPGRRRYLIRLIGVDRPADVLRGGRPLRGWHYDPAARRLQIPVPAVRARAGATIRIERASRRAGAGRRAPTD